MGLASALAWGFSAYLGAIAARHVGAWLTNTGSALTSLAVLLPLAVVAMPNRPADATLADVVLLGAIGIGALLLDFVVYRLLTVAPVAIIYPIIASNGAVVTALAVIVLGEQLSSVQLAGVLLVAGGVFAIAWPGRAGEPAIASLADEELVAAAVLLSDAAPPGPAAPTRAPAVAILTAIGVTLLAGMLLFVVAESTKRLGWYQPIIIDRLAQGVLIVVLLAAGFPPRRTKRPERRAWWVAVATVGALNAVAAALYAYGNQVGSTAVTATAASTFAAVPVVLGIVLLGERPLPHQLAGIVAALAGIVALGAG